ncbi:hypothetical protein SAMN04490239_0589 [Rhodococcus koreensis]|uniref:Uncharacterized protein n=1 Tax=Rhodococcus koreensis TaxID=99653 RepID=A0A1H4IG81_9NOCA|nr:hypothetical protein SAMN04490239_0589 [Rhodococcus koreensis]
MPRAAQRYSRVRSRKKCPDIGVRTPDFICGCSERISRGVVEFPRQCDPTWRDAGMDCVPGPSVELCSLQTDDAPITTAKTVLWIAYVHDSEPERFGGEVVGLRRQFADRPVPDGRSVRARRACQVSAGPVRLNTRGREDIWHNTRRDGQFCRSRNVRCPLWGHVQRSTLSKKPISSVRWLHASTRAVGGVADAKLSRSRSIVHPVRSVRYVHTSTVKDHHGIPADQETRQAPLVRG